MKMIGLIGGNGSFASAYFYRLLLEKSRDFYGAKNNSDFPRIVIDSVPVPDFISDMSQIVSARAILESSARKLANYGCTEIAVVCNTIYLLKEKLNEACEGKLVSIVDLVAARAKSMGLKRIGILASPTTLRLNIYGKALETLGMLGIGGENELQGIYETIIRQLVAGRVSETQKKELTIRTQALVHGEKLDGIILGCTELPLVFPKNKFKNVIDCMDVLADELLFRYYAKGGKHG